MPALFPLPSAILADEKIYALSHFEVPVNTSKCPLPPAAAMEAWVPVELWAPADSPEELLPLKLAPGSTTGFVGVHKAGKRFEARKWVTGKGTRVAFKSSDPRECAWVLARLELYPVPLPSPRKGRAKPGEGKVCARPHGIASACPLTVGVLRRIVLHGARSRELPSAQRAARRQG